MDDTSVTTGLPQRAVPVVFYRHDRAHSEVVASLKQLVRQNAFKAMVLCAAAEGIVGIDANGLIGYANPAAARLWGGSKRELRGLPLALVVGEDGGDERVFRRRDGTNLVVEYHHTPITRHGKPVGAVVSFTDITRRKELEAEMRQSQRLLAEAEALARLGSWEWTLHTNRLTWSDQFYRVLGLVPRAVEPSFEGLIERSHPEDRARVREAIALASRGRPFDFEHRVVTPDGDLRMLHCRGEAVLDAQGQPVKLVGTAQDVTEMARAREALRQSEEREHQIEIMRRSDALKDQLMNTLSHELRTPISVISGFTNIIQEELAGPLTAEQRDYLGQIQGEADHLLKLINDLLELGQIQAGKLMLDPHPVHLAEIVKDVFAQMAPMAEEKQQHLVDEVPLELPLVQADDARIAQVLTHLLLNAIKFGPEGSTTYVRACVDGGALYCEVEDGGVGIPDEQVPKLFQRFTQLDMTTTRRYGGVGIGLFISKALIEAHHGAIGLTRVPGRGNTFWFSLPLRAA
ncbi:MAG: domain S-box [Cyanobacteria bacterium RYN_339]|nr:domain S-box [Cyanobacteria bacterium RYN_339]